MLSFLSRLRSGGKLGGEERPTEHPTEHPTERPTLAETSNHFRGLSNRWWEEDGPFAVLHVLNPVRLRWLKQQVCQHFDRDVRNPEEQGRAKADRTTQDRATQDRTTQDRTTLAGLRILDVGCGGGVLTEPLARMKGQVTGLDILPENIQCAQEHAQLQGLDIDYCACDLASFGASPDRHGAFDVVIAFEVIEHVEDPGAFLHELSQLLRPGGLLLLSTLNRTFRSYLLGIVAAERLLGWVPPGTHIWQAFIPPSDLRWHITRAGLEPGVVQGLSFSLVRRAWRLSDDLSINYFAAASKPE